MVYSRFKSQPTKATVPPISETHPPNCQTLDSQLLMGCTGGEVWAPWMFMDGYGDIGFGGFFNSLIST